MPIINETPVDSTPLSRQTSTNSTGGSLKKKGTSSVKRRPVACKSCHSLKVKCIPSDPNDFSSPCIRCIKSKRVCEIDLTQTRKRKKPDDSTRVTELELRVEKLSHQLKQQNTDDQSPVSTSSEGSKSQSYLSNKDFTTFTPQFYKQNTSNQRSSTPNSDKGKQYEGGLKFVMENNQFRDEPNATDSVRGTPKQPETPKPKVILTKEQEIEKMFGPNILTEISNCVTATSESRLSKVQRPATDLIAIGLLSLSEAKERFALYQSKIYSNYPFIKINEDFDELRRREPLLFNAVMSVTGIIQEPTGKEDIERDIEIESIALKDCLNEFMIVGNKTIGLLKCLLMLSIWYNTPELFHHRRYHVISSLCITMVQDLGLTGRPYYVVNKTEGSFKRSAILEDPQKDEYRCLVLGVYCASIGYSLFLRRRLQVCWSPYMEECYVHLKSSSDENYRTMAKFAKVSSFLERIHLHVDSKDQDNTALIEYLLYEIDCFKRDSDMTMPSDVVMSFISSIEAFLYSKLSSPEYCFKCLKSCSDTLNYFGKLSPEDITACPLLIFGRLMYCFALLLKTTNTLHLNFDFESIKEIMVPLKACCDKFQKNHMIIKIRLLFYFYLTTFAKNEDAFNNLASYNSTDAVAKTLPMRPNRDDGLLQPGQNSSQLQSLSQHDINSDRRSSSHRLSFSLPDSNFNYNVTNQTQSSQNNRVGDVPGINNGTFAENQNQENIGPNWSSNTNNNNNNNNNGFGGINHNHQPNGFYDNQIPELNNEPIYPRLDMLSDATLKGFSELNDFTSPQSNDFWKIFDYKDDQFFL